MKGAWDLVRRTAAHPVARGLAVVLLQAAAARLERGPRETAGPAREAGGCGSR